MTPGVSPNLLAEGAFYPSRESPCCQSNKYNHIARGHLFFFVINLTLHQFHHSNQKSPGHWRFPPSEAMDQSFQAIILSSFGLDQRIQRHPRCKFNDFNLIYAFGIIWQLSISSVLSGPGYADTFICFDPCLYSLPFHETPKT